MKKAKFQKQTRKPLTAIGWKVKRALDARGLNYAEAIEQAGVNSSPSRISSQLRRVDPHLSTLRKLAAIAGMSLSELVSDG